METKTGNKESLGDLALLGGPPLFDRELHVGYPNTGDRERFFERVGDIFDRGRLTNNGPYVREFEGKVAEFSGTKHCIAVCNGTVALELAIRSMGMEGEVILPSLTFAATAHALLWSGVKPVFCDVAYETLCLDPHEVEKMITPRTTGIIGVHLFGRIGDVETLRQIADKRGLKLLFDAAHAFGCTKNGKGIGSFGNAEVFSFHATKVVNCFEGGAVLTNDDRLSEKLRSMRDFGFKGVDQVVGLGTNGKMSEVSAAMGLTSLEGFEGAVAVNKRNYGLYRELLAGIAGISVLPFDLREKNNFQYVVLDIDGEISGISRDELLNVLRAENILARRYFYPGCHRMEPYSSMAAHPGPGLAITDRMNSRLMQLPTGNSIETPDIEKICALIHFCAGNGSKIRERRACQKN